MRVRNKHWYKESIRKCRRSLNERRFNEQTWQEFIAPSVEIFKTIAATAPQEIKDDVDEMLSSGEVDSTGAMPEVSEEDLDKDGLLTEGAAMRRKRLQEVQGLSKAVRAYIDDDGAQDYGAFIDWCFNNNYKAITEDPRMKKGVFNTKYKELTGKGGPVVSGGDESVEEPEEEYQMSSDLAELMSMCNAAERKAEDAVTTCKGKYRQLRAALRDVITGNSNIQYAIITGDAGIGKSHSVRENLDLYKKKNVPVFSGSKGASITAVYQFLWEHHLDELIVLDDCDSMLLPAKTGDTSSPATLLKAALEEPHVVSIGPDHWNKVQANIEKLAASKGDAFPEELLEVPPEFAFDKTRVLFISNLNIDENLGKVEVDPAILSRCAHFQLNLTKEEFMVRLAEILYKIDCGQGTTYDEQEVIEVKALLHKTILGLFEASDHHVPFFGKNIHVKQRGFEFRMVKQLVGNFMTLVEMNQEDNPGISRDEAKKMSIEEWVMVYVIPRLTK